ncbi:MAG: 50S ribosome-binding GTPase [Candidatus Magnetomorum sp.]|nr:50S ribosome-binding GTPase [Candidatus Magnetomorum sp.]
MIIKGISTDPVVFREQINQARQHFQLFKWKQHHVHLPNIIVLLGGTGTGKSTLFNALIEEKISVESVRRPTTSGGIAYVHSKYIGSFQESKNAFPFSTDSHIPDNLIPFFGNPKKLTLVSHEQASFLPIVIDSPDVDSVCLENKDHAQKLFLLADIIVFVTSCEKYADHEPLEIINKAKKDGKKIIIVLNKSDDEHLAKSIHEQLMTIVLPPNVQFFPIPRRKEAADSEYQKVVTHLRNHILDLSNDSKKLIKKQDVLLLSKRLNQLISDLQIKIDAETAAYKEIEQILLNAAQTAKDMLMQSPATFDRAYFDACIKPHIKAVYQRYDLLAPVRKWIFETIRKPFFLLSSTHQNQANNLPHPPEMDLTPVLSALAEYQYYVKKHVNAAIFQQHLQARSPELDQKMINQLFQEKMIAINRWLTEQFQTLNQGIPVQKRVGIHALSLIWGTAIVGLEAMSGGGLSPIELALDSVIAPYLTAGATELFVVNELKTIVHNLRNQYMKALHAIIEHQHRAYVNILEILKPETTRPRNGLVLM